MKIFLVLILMSFKAFSIPETHFEHDYSVQVLPHFQNMRQDSFINAQGLKINFYSKISLNAKKTIVIAPGRIEPAAKYAEVIYDIDSPGTNIFIIDHQGQGESQRLLEDTQKGYVLNFQDYVNDFEQFVREEVLPQTAGTKKYLLAHSMGGAISVHYLNQHPGIFLKAAIVAPMLQIKTDPYPPFLANMITCVMKNFKHGTYYVPGAGPYLAENDNFSTTIYTHSEKRFLVSKNLFAVNPEMISAPQPTVRWVHESVKAIKNIHRLAPQIKIPVLVLQAGLDKVVAPSEQNKFCSGAVNCRLIGFPEAFHEILMEKDAIRDTAIQNIKGFL